MSFFRTAESGSAVSDGTVQDSGDCAVAAEYGLDGRRDNVACDREFEELSVLVCQLLVCRCERSREFSRDSGEVCRQAGQCFEAVDEGCVLSEVFSGVVVGIKSHDFKFLSIFQDSLLSAGSV